MTNQWINHVKQYAAEHGCTYSEALKRAKSSYQSTTKPRRKSMKGKGAFDFLDPNKNGVNKFFTRDLPSSLIHQGLPVVGATLGGIAGAELGPVGSMGGAYIGRKAGEATAKKIGKLYGYGLHSDLKKVEKAALKRVSKGKGLLEDLEKNYIVPYRPEIKYGIDYAKNRFPDEYGAVKNAIRGDMLKGSGNFWEDIQPMTTYLRPAGDALLDKTVETIKGLGLKRRKHKKRMTGKALLPAGNYGP